jgi:hypothetical protein
MKCSLHAAVRQTSVRCSLCDSFEREMLMLGPRTLAEYAHLLRKYKIPEHSAVPFTASAEPNVFEHIIFAKAKALGASLSPPVSVRSLFANARHAQWVLANAASPYLRKHIELVSGSMVKGKTPLGAHNAASLQQAVRRAGIKGVSRIAVAGEYKTAWSDMLALIENGHVRATQTHVWHADNVVDKEDETLEH